MDSVTLIKLTILMLFLAGRAHCQPFRFLAPPRAPTPLCTSQFALVNHACSRLPYTALPLPSPAGTGDSSNGRDPPAHRRHRRRGHSHGHGQADDGNVNLGSAVQDDGTPQGECCRWMKAVDSMCVCDLLVQLPTFLSKPLHNYTVFIEDNCSLTFQCPGRIRG